MLEFTQKTIITVIVSAIFAADYGVTHVYDSYSDTQKDKIIATELRDEEKEQMQQMQLLLRMREEPLRNYHSSSRYRKEYSLE